MSTRWLGTILIVSTVVVIANGLRGWGAGLEGPIPDKITQIAYTIWGIGGVCGIVALIRLNALGSNAVARALGFLPLIGFAAFILGGGLAAVGFITPDDSLYEVLAGIAWLAMLAGMVLVGILTIAAKSWTGWRCFAPLLTIVMVLVGIVIGQAVGSIDVGAMIGYSGFLLLGYVIATAEPAPALPQSVTA